MKKLVFATVAIVAMSFASCGNSTKAVSVNDSDSVASVDTTVVDSISVDSVK